MTDVLRRLKAAGVEERDYYAEWYGALSLMNDALSRLRKGAGLVYAPNTPQQLLSRPPSAKSMLTERGQLIALFNRFPARVPLVVDGVPASPQSPVQGVAAWTEDKTALVVYLYQSEAETRSVRVDLTALKRRFAFWAAEQLAADLTARRTGPRVPVVRKQKVGSALSQSVSFECLPASFTRIVFKE